MRQGARSAVTIVVLGTILAIGAVWGWRAMTEPFPGFARASSAWLLLCRRLFPERTCLGAGGA